MNDEPSPEDGSGARWRAVLVVVVLVLVVPGAVALRTAVGGTEFTPSRAATAEAARPPLTSADSSCYSQPGPAEPSPTGPIRFTEVTRAAGLCHLQHELHTPPDCFFNQPSDTLGPNEDDNARTFLSCLDERMTGGVAVGDFDGDGDADVYLTQLRQGPPGRLYRNDGHGTFVDVTASAQLDRVEGNGNGAAWADVDGDGRRDLVVTTIGSPRSFLFMNNGDGTFREEAERRGVAMNDGRVHRGFSIATGDYDNDGFVDLFVTEWSNPSQWTAAPSAHARLLHNRGRAAPGSYEDTTEHAHAVLGVPGVVPLHPAYEPYLSPEDKAAYRTASFTAAFADLDRDGWADLVVISDFGTSQLFWNNGDGTFTDGTASAGLAKEGNGMGLAIADLDGDGRLDLFVTAISQRTEPRALSYTGNRMYRNAGDRTFEDVTGAWGLGDGDWGWGTAAADFDHDGWRDLVMTNGQFTGMNHDILGRAEHAATPKRLWRNRGGGHFDEIARPSGITTTADGKGLVTFDMDGDGDLDLLLVNNGAFPTLYRNDSPPAGWIGVRVRSNASPSASADAAGAVVRVTDSNGRVQEEPVGATGFLGQSDAVANFGLGRADGAVEVSVEWPAVSSRPATISAMPGRVVDVAIG